MSSTDTAPASRATSKIERSRVTWTDLAWVTWRQHRLMILSTAALVLACAAAMTLLGTFAPQSSRNGYPTTDVPWRDLGFMLVLVPPVFGALVACFWAAPLLAREYELRTHLLVWSQDVSARRWLLAKTTVLGAGAAVLAVILGFAAQLMSDRIYRDGQFEEPFFSGTPLAQLGYVLYGFALGLACSAIARRTLLSMGLALAVFAVSRSVVAVFVRPYYQAPVRLTTGAGEPFPDYPLNSFLVDMGMYDTEGNAIDYPDACAFGPDDRNFQECLRNNGVAGNFVDFQPVGRFGTFQLVEFGLFTVLAAALFAVTWGVTRRLTRL